MAKTLAYLRASTDRQETDNQKLEILEYARKGDKQETALYEPLPSHGKISAKRFGC